MDKEKELAALKNRRARLWDFFANPRAIVCDGQSKQRFEELCEINNEIARLETNEKLDEEPLTANETRQLFGYPPISGETAVEHPSHYTSGGIEWIAISYPTYGDEKNMLYEIVALLGQEKMVTFRQIHYICTNEQPGPVTSTWPLVWNGLVQIDDDKLTFEFVERRATSD